ncbi:hypothetical protein [Nitrospirillum pindoramense]|uniref:Flagellin-like hook-associated protein FlgL n=1 Tax=Nitrospirillum amazonense TaxID=28077 RepID=A0A560HBT0_9PROT|nr:hypothetical protein [Nitrospirillum amazonense]TWB43823.1 hypothetical protein FBZ90_104211 [Nitrospirillum amazonense]
MTISRVSSYGNYLSLLNGINGSSTTLADLQQQFNSGIKSQDLSAYGSQANRLLDLKTQYAQHTGYANAITTATTQVNATETALSSMQTIVSNLLSSANIPAGAGSPSVSAVTSSSNGNLGLSVDSSKSVFAAAATYTVTAVPSNGGKAGSYDVTVNDGMGGISTKTINLTAVPPDDGQQTFQMTGGPGDGASISLNINQLKGPGSATFSVAYPDLAAPKALLQGALTQLSSLLNTKAGDRYIFAGSRYDTAPVGNLSATKQVSQVTLTGNTLGTAGDIYTMSVAGKQLTYTTTGSETSMSDILNAFASQINDPNQLAIANGQTPPLPLTASVIGNQLTLIGNSAGYSFDVSSNVYPVAGYQNTVTPAGDPTLLGYPGYTSHTDQDNVYSQYTSQLAVAADPTAVPPTTAVPQIDNVTLNGPSVDVGDVFTINMGNRNTINVTSDDANAANNISYDKVEGPTAYTYVMTTADLAAMKSTGLPTANPPVAAGDAMGYVAAKLAAQINADPHRSADATVTLNPPGSAQVTLTGMGSQRFATTSTVQNNTNQNQMTAVTLAPYQAPGSFSTTVTTPPNLAPYDSQYQSAIQNASAFASSSLNVDDSTSVTYGISSNDPAIQSLVISIKQMLSAVNNPGNYTALMSSARSSIVSAQSQIRQLDASTVNAQSLLGTAATNHKNALADIENQIGSIQNVDPTTVAAQLQAALNQQQGAYTVAGKIASLSLVNFLS